MASLALTTREGRESFAKRMIPRIVNVLPRHMTPERMTRIVCVEMVRNPALAECTEVSLAASIVLASELGLEPSGPRGEFYMIPYDLIDKVTKRKVKTCVPIVGYKGMCKLALNSPDVRRLNAGVVYADEIKSGAFVATREPPEVHHAFQISDEKRFDSQILAAYAVAEMHDGRKAIVLLERQELEARRGRSQAAESGPWVTDYAAMARKTAIRALLTGGLVPLTAGSPFAKAVDVETEAENDWIETTAEPVEEEHGVNLAAALGVGEATEATPAETAEPEKAPARRRRESKTTELPLDNGAL